MNKPVLSMKIKQELEGIDSDRPLQASSHPIPKPLKDEQPALYADRVGRSFIAQISPERQKSLGIFLTPPPVAYFTAQRLTRAGIKRILDPAAGAGILLCAMVENLVRASHHHRVLEIVAYEIDSELVEVLSAVLQYLKKWAAAKGVSIATKIHCEDFVLANAEALQTLESLITFSRSSPFDAVIANPPYFKIGKGDRRAQAAASVVHGQPNIYGLFMAVSAALLRPEGVLGFITPRSFASGPYFRLFREKFFQLVRPEAVHLFDSRRDAFSRDDVLQENIIFAGVRSDRWSDSAAPFQLQVSTSTGMSDLGEPSEHSLNLRSMVDMSSRHKVLKLPASEQDIRVLELVDGWAGSLAAYGLQISTGPVVPFRATEFLDNSGASATHAPLIWMNHVHAMRTTWPNGARKPQYIKLSAAERGLLLPERNFVLMRRFSAKEEHRRLVAAPFMASNPSSLIGLENHLNYIHRPRGTLTETETWGLTALLNSALLDTYFRATNGNTQVSATELRAMPLPEHHIVEEIGRRARHISHDGAAIDALVEELAVNARPMHKRKRARNHV